MRELLSDGEHFGQLFASMDLDLDDCLEQCRLSLDDAEHPLSAYEYRTDGIFPGTLKLAKELGIAHPSLKERDDTTDWVFTTDLVLVERVKDAPRTALAVSIKPKGFRLAGYARQLLRVEREYWLRRNTPWLLITPSEYERAVVNTLRRIAPWALDDAVEPAFVDELVRTVYQMPGTSLTKVIERGTGLLGSEHLAQCALWQAVWNGVLPIDLRRGWRPHVPLRPISTSEFNAFNPILSRRSAWT